MDPFEDNFVDFTGKNTDVKGINDGTKTAEQQKEENTSEEPNFIPHLEIVSKRDIPGYMTPIAKNADSDEDENEAYSDDDGDFILYTDYVKNVNINHTNYRWYLILSAMWMPKRWNKKYGYLASILFYLYRTILSSILLSFISFEFGLFCWCTYETWLQLDEKFPFTIADYIIWNLRWFSTYVLGTCYCSMGHFAKLLTGIQLPVIKWQRTRKKLHVYLIFIFLLLVAYPCGILLFDLDWLEKNQTNKYRSLPNPVILIWKFISSLIILPSFCLITVVLHLLGDHVLAVGKRVCVLSPKDRTKPLTEVKAIFKELKTLIRKTEQALSPYLILHLFLLIFCAFTTMMSTIERLQIRSNSTLNKNLTSSPLVFPIVNFDELLRAKENLEKTKILLTSSSIQDNSTLCNVSNTKMIYESLSKTQEIQIDWMEKLITFQMDQNNTLRTGSDAFYKFIISIEDRRSALRVIMDNILSIVEILILYMVPLYLIIRIDSNILKVEDFITDIDVPTQLKNGWVFNTNEEIKATLKYVATVRGIRVFGVQIQFFKTLILATFAPFCAIAMRGIWKHYGFF